MRKEELASRPELKQQQQSRGRNCLEIVDASKKRKKARKQFTNCVSRTMKYILTERCPTFNVTIEYAANIVEVLREI